MLDTLFNHTLSKKWLLLISIAILAFIALSACAPAPIVAPAAAPEPTTAAAAAKPHWTYEGAEGPEHWGELPGYETCATGKSQSPINVTNAGPKDLANVVFNYQPSEVKILNNGHTVQVNYDKGSTIEVDGKRYDLLQFHFHAPSEHAIDGKLAAAELHLVHQSADGKLAVVGVLLEKGAENAAFKPVWDNLPATVVTEKATGVQVAAADLLPQVKTTYRYSGSLTTPPCSEGVTWLLMTSPVEMSEAQLAAFAHLFEHGDARPVQPLNDRDLTVDSTP